MPRMSATLRPDAALQRALNNLDEQSRRAALRDGLEAGALVAETNVKLRLSSPGTGHEYTHGSVVHQASAPGQPPAVDTGALRASVMVDKVTAEEAVIAPHMEYAEHLEFGTVNMEPRPFLRPALDESVDEIYAAFERAVQGLIG